MAPPIVIDIGVGSWGDDWGLGVSMAEAIYKVVGVDGLDNATTDEEIQAATWFRMKSIYEQSHCLSAIEGSKKKTFNAAQLRQK